jgi:hypothetical protein
MRKMDLVFVFLCTSSLGYAGPKVGDTASYEGSIYGEVYTQTVELTEFDAGSNRFKEIRTSYDGDKSTVEEEWREASDILSTEAVHEILGNCDEQGGVIQILVIAKSKIETCKLPSNNGGYVNLGEVPFGIVRFNVVDQDRGKWVSKLVSYKFGQ